MNNPLVLFYAKIFQYFDYAGIKLINLHTQASFIFSITLYYYLLKVVDVLSLELNSVGKIAILLLAPAAQLASYLYFNRAPIEEKITTAYKTQSGGDNAISTALTIVFIIPMIIFFTRFIIG